MLGHSFPDGFSRGERGVEYALDNLPLNSNFQIIEQTGITSNQAAILKGIADWKYLFPARNINLGRTLYGQLSPSARWPCAGVKLKGAGGAKIVNGAWQISPPSPQLTYGISVENHLAVDAWLNFSVVQGSPKAVNCLSARAARQEFRCQQALSQHGLGFAPLLYGNHEYDGKAVLDYNGTPIGMVASVFDPAYQPIGNYLMVTLLHDGDSVRLVKSFDMRLYKEAKRQIDYAQIQTNFLRRLGHLKIESVLRAGLARHAGHLGNFLYDPTRDSVLMSDTDSCLLYEDLPREMWGPQFVRDVASDLFRVMNDFPRLLFTDEIIYGLERRQIKPIHAFLEGMFGDLVDSFVLDFVCNSLHAALVGFISFRRPWLNQVNRLLLEHYKEKEKGKAGLISRSTWHFTFLPLLQDALDAVFYLSSISDLPRNFKPPSLAPEEFMSRSGQAVTLMEHALEETSKQAKRKLGL